jgi:hypothetical protein
MPVISRMISPLPSSNEHAVALAGADIFPAIRTDHDFDSDRVMDPDEQRDYADQGLASDSDLDGDTQILATLLKHIPECIDAADIKLLLQDIPVQQPVVIPPGLCRRQYRQKTCHHWTWMLPTSFPTSGTCPWTLSARYRPAVGYPPRCRSDNNHDNPLSTR